jgi:hypothetical protein
MGANLRPGLGGEAAIQRAFAVEGEQLLQRAAKPADEAPMFARKAFVAASGTPK